MNIFTYGSLMFPEVWLPVVGRSFETVAATAPGFEIFRVRDAVFPGIAVGTGNCSVPGLVYRDVDDKSAERLDRFEDDFYERRSIAVDCADGQRRMADAYVVPVANLGMLTNDPWTEDWFITSGGLQDFIDRFAGFGRAREGG